MLPVSVGDFLNAPRRVATSSIDEQLDVLVKEILGLDMLNPGFAATAQSIASIKPIDAATIYTSEGFHETLT